MFLEGISHKNWSFIAGVQYCFNIHRYGIMADPSEVSVSNIFIEQIKTAIRKVRKASNRRPDVKVIY